MRGYLSEAFAMMHHGHQDVMSLEKVCRHKLRRDDERRLIVLHLRTAILNEGSGDAKVWWRFSRKEYLRP
jgi:hypothetical protein